MQYILTEKEYLDLIPKNKAVLPIGNFLKSIMAMGQKTEGADPTIIIRSSDFQKALDALQKELNT